MENTHKVTETEFVNESEIETYFKKTRKNTPRPKKFSFEHWYKADDYKGGNHQHHPFTYGHTEPISKKSLTCNDVTDEWFRWFLTTPVSQNTMTNPENAYRMRSTFLMHKKDTDVYFAAAAPFQENPPDLRRIIMTRKAPLLVPVYNMVASLQEYPGRTDEELTDIVKNDLAGVSEEDFEASFDGEPLYGCCVIRNKSFEIDNIPVDNVLGIPEDRLLPASKIKLCHGGFWLLIR
jgi:hypothetical protein